MTTLVPHLSVQDGPAALRWYVEVLGARETSESMLMPDGTLGHADLALGDAAFMLAGEFPDHRVEAPDPGRGSAVTLALALDSADEVDAMAQRMQAAGAVLDRGPEDDEMAGRVAVLRDPFGHRWFLNRPLDLPSKGR
jgi:uncharacterized glyoxalase superfamily protein PhnB